MLILLSITKITFLLQNGQHNYKHTRRLCVKKTGEIRENFAADIIGIKGNPLENISLLENVDFVMKNGNVVKP